MTSVLFINQFYFPDHSATSQILQNLAEDLVEHGFNVSVLTGNAGYEGGRLSSCFVERRRGVLIRRVCSTRFGKKSGVGRMLDYITFHLSTALRLLFLPRYDIVITLTTPPLIAWTGVLAKRVKRSLFVSWIQDIYPEIGAALGILHPRSSLFYFCRMVATHSAKAADRTVAVGEGMARRVVASGISKDRVVVIHNWADEGLIQPNSCTENLFLSKHGLTHKFVILYAGNFGLAHTFDTVLLAAERLQEMPDVEFVFVGSGRRKADIIHFASQHSLRNVSVYPYEPLESVPDLLNAGSVGLVTQSPESEGLMVPCKIYAIMAAAKPILYVGPPGSDAAQIVNRTACGYVVAPGDVDGIVQAVSELRTSKSACREMGEAGYRSFQDNFTRARAAERFVELLNRLTSEKVVKLGAQTDLEQTQGISKLEKL